MTVRKHTVAITTASDGSATAYSPYISGKICSIQYLKPGSGNFDDGVDFTITAEGTTETLWTESNVNASKVCMPRGATHSTAGVAATYDGTRAVFEKLAISRDRVKFVIASGGNAKTGTFYILIED